MVHHIYLVYCRKSISPFIQKAFFLQGLLESDKSQFTLQVYAVAIIMKLLLLEVWGSRMYCKQRLTDYKMDIISFFLPWHTKTSIMSFTWSFTSCPSLGHVYYMKTLCYTSHCHFERSLFDQEWTKNIKNIPTTTGSYMGFIGRSGFHNNKALLFVWLWSSICSFT